VRSAHVLLIAALAVSGCAAEDGEPAAQAATGPTSEPPALWRSAYDSLSARDRLRQVLMPSIDTLDPGTARAVVRSTRPGGLIIMAPGTARQWRKVTRAAQAQARALGLPPLLIAADQENGTLVRRMKMPVGLPGAMVRGAAVAGDAERGGAAAEESAALTGRWLRSAGVNMDFAPVADVNVRPSNPVIGIRSPGAFPGIVGRTAVAQVQGFEASGVAATVKHFPGHGDTATDSHVGTAVVTHSRRQMARIDLPPFADAVEAGVPAVMVAHVTVPAYGSRPATVSKRLVTGLLRESLGFEGLVVSDSLGMQAVAGRPQLAVEVLAAGVDVLLMPNDPAAAVSQVRRAAGSGALPRARVRQAVRHVLQAKDRLGLLGAKVTNPQVPTVAQSRRVARSAASAGITVLGSCRVLVDDGATVVGDGPVARGVRNGLRSAGVGPGPVRVVVSAYSPGATDVWVATGSPYQALNSPARQRVLTYGEIAASGWAAGRAIAGRTDGLGGLPVRGPRPCRRIR
jgi:beta-N-acetylhexosaminidase